MSQITNSKFLAYQMPASAVLGLITAGETNDFKKTNLFHCYIAGAFF